MLPARSYKVPAHWSCKKTVVVQALRVPLARFRGTETFLWMRRAQAADGRRPKPNLEPCGTAA